MALLAEGRNRRHRVSQRSSRPATRRPGHHVQRPLPRDPRCPTQASRMARRQL